MRHPREAAIALTLLLATGSGWLQPAPAAAQARVFGGAAYADVELGVRLLPTRPAPLEYARFQEYRDLREGLVVPAFRGWFDSEAGRSRVELLGRYPGQDDQSLRLRVQRLGTFSLELERDMTAHVFSTNGRLLGTSPERGVLTLPVPRPTGPEFDAAPALPAIRTQWTQDRAALLLAPAGRLGSLVQYSRVEKRGDRPMGMAFGSAGSNHREILEPIEHTLHNVRIAPSWRTARYQVQVTYDYSSFENQLDAVVADNPLVATDQATAGSSRGRTALAPSNQAHTLAMQGAATLPLRGRVSTAVVYGWRRQTATVLPYTINTAINTSALTPLPADIDGDVRTQLVRVAASMRPLPAVTVGARYRRFELDDRTTAISLNGRVTSDRTLSTTPIQSHRYPYTRQTAGADLRWRLNRGVAVQLDAGWDAWDRDGLVREVAETRENTQRLTLDLTPLPWLGVHSSVLRSRRRGDGYEEKSASQLPLIRKHDLSDRDRERIDVAVHASPWAALALGASHAFGENDYTDARYGRNRDRNRATGVTAMWQVLPRLALHGSYLEETFRVRQRSRYRTGTQLQNETYDWIANTNDDVVTAGLGATATVIPRRLDVGVNWDRIVTESQVLAANPQDPAGGTTAQNTAATASDFPATRYEFNPISAFVRYRMHDSWLLTATYRQELFQHLDWRTDGLLPATGSDVFMGNDLLDYKARILTLTVRYSPRIPGLAPIL